MKVLRFLKLCLHSPYSSRNRLGLVIVPDVGCVVTGYSTAESAMGASATSGQRSIPLFLLQRFQLENPGSRHYAIWG